MKLLGELGHFYGHFYCEFTNDATTLPWVGQT